jgi:hypothetical protein
MRSSMQAVFAVLATLVGPPTVAAAQTSLPWRPLSVPAGRELGFDPAAPLWLDERRLLLVDQHERQVVIFDVSTGGTTRLGRAGQGPGEFAGSMLPIRWGRGFAIWDVASRRLTRFDRSLTMVGTTSFTTGFSTVASIGDTLLVGIGGLGGRPVVYRLDVTSTRVDSLFAIAEADTALLARPMSGMPGPAPVVGGIGGTNDLTLFSQWSYALAKTDRGGRVIAAGGRRALPPAAPSAATVAARRARMEQATARMDSVTRKQMAPMFERSLTMPDPHIILGGLGGDTSGCLYAVTTRRRADSTEVDVFGPNAGFVRTLAVPGKVTAVSRDGEAMVFVSERLHGEAEGASDLLIFRPTRPGATCQ